MNAIVKRKDQVPATADEAVDAISEWCDEEGGDFAAFLKFVKGTYRYGIENDVLPLGTRLMPNMNELRVGFIKWRDGEVVKQQMGLVANKAGVKREDLDDADESLWPRDTDGKLTDPWTQVRTLPMKDPATGTEYVFTTSSEGGNRAVLALTRHWTRQYKGNLGKLPVIEIGSDTYPHKIYGQVHYPVFKLVGWESEADLIASKESDTASFLNDEIPDLTGATP